HQRRGLSYHISFALSSTSLDFFESFSALIRSSRSGLPLLPGDLHRLPLPALFVKGFFQIFQTFLTYFS
ncbi:hypothetical protein, partial [Flintibacter muris]|uniref:hypothetical protein n=1 Tax=Flintibacter muris TaxID=2941327 RepID=UPI00203C208F